MTYRGLAAVTAASLAAALAAGAAQAADCGAPGSPCRTATGTYHVVLPEREAPRGLVMHLHGGGGTGKGLLKSGLAREALRRGYVFVAPQGYHPNNRYKNNWSVLARNTSHERNDMDFLADVLADVRERHGIDTENRLLSGFSRGGSMVWDIACRRPAMASAYASVAGAFWDDLPARCEAPVMLFHAHGWNDRTVPLEGRSLRNHTVVQGDVWASLFILRETNGCRNRQPASTSRDDGTWWRHWSDCDAGRIDLMLFPGGHGVPKGWAGAALDWFESRVEEAR